MDEIEIGLCLNIIVGRQALLVAGRWEGKGDNGDFSEESELWGPYSLVSRYYVLQVLAWALGGFSRCCLVLIRSYVL